MAVKFSGFFYAGTILLAMQGIGVFPAIAQDRNAVVSGCASGGSCDALVAGYVDSLRAAGATAEAIDHATADLTAELSIAAQATLTASNQIVTGIRAAATATSNAAVRTQMLEIALTLAVGDTVPAVAASGT